MCNDEVLLTTSLDVPLKARGKVRDVYDLGDSLLFIATDRISAFDCILGSGIPCKGRVLTQTSQFWFDFLQDLVPNHVLTSDVRLYPFQLAPYTNVLAGRSMLVKKARMVNVECVARGYLSGSGWKEYQRQGTVCGIRLPAGLEKVTGFPNPFSLPPQRQRRDTTKMYPLTTWPIIWEKISRHNCAI